MQVLRPTWSSWSLLVYTGGFTVLGAAAAALSYLSGNYGNFAYVGWSLLVLAVILAVAGRLRRDHPYAAGVFGFVGVPLFAAFLAALWKWWGWSLHSGSPVAGFHVSRLGWYLLVLLFAVAMVRRFRAPIGVTWVLLLKWLFVVDLVSSGGNWTAWVSIILGLAFLIAGMTYDSGERRPYGFWLHVASGLAIGVALLDFWHSGNWHWSFIAIAALVFIRVAVATNRSSWAFFGAAGILAAATHFTVQWWHRGLPFIGGTPGTPRGWVPPLVFGITGFVLVLLGFAVSRRERR
ncbi:MAG TPA: hypothetical protein VGL84_06690 [Gaiellaceae bacterium]